MTRNLRWHETPATHRLAASFAGRGYIKSPTRFHAPWKPWCDNPVRVHRHGRGGKGLHSVEVEWDAPCRQCDKCIEVRRRLWRNRLRAELAAHSHNFLVTLTFTDAMLAIASMRSDGTPGSLERECYEPVQRYLKRLRKRMGDFRFVAIFERGDLNGRPHFHLVIHRRVYTPLRAFEEANTTRGGRVVSVRLWPARMRSELVRTRGVASYLAGYLTKSADGRPRASLGYGRGGLEEKQH